MKTSAIAKGILTGLLLIAPCMLRAQEQPKTLPDNPVPKVEDKGPAHSDPYNNRPHDAFWDTHRPSDRHFWLINTEAYVSDLAPLIGGLHCRHRNGVEPCTEHYGAFYQGWVASSIIEAAAGTAVYHMCRRNYHNSAKCDIIQQIVVGGNVGWGLHEGLINRPSKD